MKVLLQRVRSASVSIEEKVVARINQGLLVFVAVQKEDTEALVEPLVHKVLNYRVFADAQQKMNLSLLDIQAELLIVSQFTLAADTSQGLRAGFSKAAPPDIARQIYQRFLACAKQHCEKVQSGVFAADMQIALINDGPVTFLLE